MALSTCVKVTRLIYSSKPRSSYPSTHLSLPPKRSKRCLEAFTQSESWDQNGSSLFPLVLTMFSRYENILLHLTAIELVIKLGLSGQHSLVYQLDGYLASINLN